MKRSFETLLSQREAAAREAEEAKRLALADERAGEERSHESHESRLMRHES